MEIPKIVIEFFLKRFSDTYPSIIEVHPPYNEIFFKKLIDKQNLWVHKKINESKKLVFSEKLIEYDPTGIFIFINNDNTIFILTTQNKLEVSDYTVQLLKKL